jgi:hypothetical protein
MKITFRELTKSLKVYCDARNGKTASTTGRSEKASLCFVELSCLLFFDFFDECAVCFD